MAGAAFDHLAVETVTTSATQAADGERDGGAAERHRPVAGDPRHRGIGS